MEQDQASEQSGAQDATVCYNEEDEYHEASYYENEAYYGVGPPLTKKNVNK